MKKSVILFMFCLLFSSQVLAQFSFELIDNFEDGNFTEGARWWSFGSLKIKTSANPSAEVRDLIAASCGDYSLNLAGETKDWYVGGIGTDLNMEAERFSRFQMDIYGHKEYRGKIIIELYDDDNGNNILEQNPAKNFEATCDDKWIAEVNIEGKGFTRVSIPFSAFRIANPGVGDGKWNPDQKNDSGGLLKLQMVAITEKQTGKLDFNIDNVLLTY
ncbi:MAG: hypothetical protein WC890_07155 [Candidatus Margulisiibacteriota bacterium]